MSVIHFLASFAEYEARTKAWTRGAAFHRSYGHLAKRRIEQTQQLMGGIEMPHDEDCPCSQCGDWHRVFLEDPEGILSDIEPLQP